MLNDGMNEVNPGKLGRENVRGMTIDTFRKKLEKMKDEIDGIVDDYVPQDDDPKANKALKEISKDLGKAISKLKGIK